MNYQDLEERYVEAENGVKLYCKHSKPSDEAIIFLHGFPEVGSGWRHQIEAFGEAYQIIVPNLRGYHQSSQPKGIKSYAVETLIVDIKCILDTYGLSKAIIVAHDWGGALAWSFTAFYPERVEKLIILNMPHPDEFRKQIWDNKRQMRKSYYALLFQIPLLPELVFHTFPKWFFHTVFQKRSLRPEAFSKEDLVRIKSAFPNLKTWTSTINYYRAFYHYPAPTLPKIKPPVGMIWGEQDFALGKELTFATSSYCEKFLGIRYIPEASHWLQHEYPVEVNSYIREFLETERV